MGLKESTRLYAISRGDYRMIGIKNKFLKVRLTYDNFLVVSIQGKYLSSLLPK